MSITPATPSSGSTLGLRETDDAGRPESDWPRVRAALDQLRPLTSEALTAIFEQTMSRAVEVAFGKELDRGLARKS